MFEGENEAALLSDAGVEMELGMERPSMAVGEKTRLNLKRRSTSIRLGQ